MADNTSTWVFHCAEMVTRGIEDTAFGADIQVQITAQVDATFDIEL